MSVLVSPSSTLKDPPPELLVRLGSLMYIKGP